MYSYPPKKNKFVFFLPSEKQLEKSLYPSLVIWHAPYMQESPTEYFVS